MTAATDAAERRQRAMVGLGGAAVAAFGLWALTRPRKAETHAARLLRVVAAQLPEPTSIFAEPNPQWDAVLGGKQGPDRWRYYQWAKGSKYGTTCGIYAAACAALAGWPRELINREPPEGSGYKPGYHIARLWDGGKALGWRLDYDGKSALVPGDIYCQVHEGLFNGKPTRIEHVGIVLSCVADGAGWSVETADGGQTHPETGRQCATRTRRALHGRTITNTKYGATAELIWLVRPQG